jgi:ABC-type glutathione transport system ATPase component
MGHNIQGRGFSRTAAARIRETMIEIRNLTISYGGEPVVANVSWRIDAGTVAGLLGASGSGKSTLGRAIMGRLPMGARTLTGTIHRNGSAALIPQEPALSLNPYLRAGDQVAHCALPRRVGREAILSLFTSLGLEEPERIFRCYPHQLSGGQQQRVAWAQALVQEPAFLVADEPTTALDPILQRELALTVTALAREKQTTVLWISHDPHLLGEVATSIGVLRAGRLVEQGEARTILREPQHDYTRAFLDAAQ